MSGADGHGRERVRVDAVRVACEVCHGTRMNPEEPTCACGHCSGNGWFLENPTVAEEPIGDQPEPATPCWEDEE